MYTILVKGFLFLLHPSETFIMKYNNGQKYDYII